jgi:two-component system, OmpR family, sensor histidine kinase VicK
VPSSSSSSSNATTERTEVLYGTENTTSAILEFLSDADTKMDICADSTWPSVAMGIDVFRNALIDIKKRGIRPRYITTITKDNLSYCKEAMKIGELRHLDGIKGNFAVSESEYMASATLQEAKLLQQVIYSNVKEVLEQQQYVFDSFWNRSVPAEQKIKEIEEGVILGRTEVIQNPKDIQQLFINMIKLAKHEVLLVLPTINAFYREERIGIIELLKQAAERDHRVNVRILTPTNDAIEKKLQNMVSGNEQRDTEGKEREEQQMKNKKKSFDMRRIDIESTNEDEKEVLVAEKSAVTTVTIIVVDRKESLVIEKTDDSKQNFIEAVGIATYSNSKPTVLSYFSIFENLWKQTELYQQLKESNKQLEFAYKQLKISDKMQSEFISAAAHELRTPIQPIISSVGIIRSRKGNMKVQELDYSLDMITRNAERLRQLSSHILDVTKIEGNSLELEKEQLNLSEVLFNTVEDYKNQITKANVNIKLLFKSYEDTLQVEADRYRIVQVFSNLLNNAIKFTRKKGGIVNVEIQKKNNKIKNNQSVAMISVKDTGSGIDPDIMLRLFEKFAAKSFQGVGLGLFISKKIIEAHGGKIWAENNSNNDNTDDVQQGKGATFFFTLPISNNQINNEDKHTEQEKTRIA